MQFQDATQDSMSPAYLAARPQGLATAQQFESMSQWVHAEVIYRRMLAVEPRDLLIRECLVRCIYAQGRLEDALGEFRVFADAAPISSTYDDIYLRSMRATKSNPMPFKRRWRFAALIEELAASLEESTEGCILECGCYMGLSSHLMCSAVKLLSPPFDGSGYHIVDSFQGLSTPTIEDAIPADHKDAQRLGVMLGAGNFAATLEEVRANLSEFPGICYHPGWVPQVLATLPEMSYRFVHLDLDLHVPTKAALKYFWPKLTPGGRLVCDDYNWPGAKIAIDEFCVEFDLQPQITSLGQAVLRPLDHT